MSEVLERAESFAARRADDDDAQGKPRLVVVWRVTDRCNLSCGFCAHDSRLSFERKQADARQVLDFGALLSAYARRTKTRTHLSLLGGEPLLWPPLVHVERELAERGVSLGITTNGTTLEAARVRSRLLAHYDEVTVSVDGIGAIHDELRGHVEGFESLRRGVRQLITQRGAAARPLVRINTVLMHQTIGAFPELCRELARWGVDEITCNELGGRDRPEFYPAHRLRPADVDAFARQLGELQRELSVLNVRLRGGPDYVRRMKASALGLSWPVADCRPGERFLFVDADGSAGPCNFTLPEYAVGVEELLDDVDLSALPERFSSLRRNARADACNDCRSTQVFAKYNEPLIDLRRSQRDRGVCVNGT